MNNSDMPAMPVDDAIGFTEEARHVIGVGRMIETKPIIATGLTKREHFAGLAMQGYASYLQPGNESYIAQQCVAMADALLAELDKDNGNAG